MSESQWDEMKHRIEKLSRRLDAVEAEFARIKSFLIHRYGQEFLQRSESYDPAYVHPGLEPTGDSPESHVKQIK
jgi:hypothetical protein